MNAGKALPAVTGPIRRPATFKSTSRRSAPLRPAKRGGRRTGLARYHEMTTVSPGPGPRRTEFPARLPHSGAERTDPDPSSEFAAHHRDDRGRKLRNRHSLRPRSGRSSPSGRPEVRYRVLITPHPGVRVYATTTAASAPRGAPRLDSKRQLGDASVVEHRRTVSRREVGEDAVGVRA
jgi:hypothetical protein